MARSVVLSSSRKYIYSWPRLINSTTIGRKKAKNGPSFTLTIGAETTFGSQKKSRRAQLRWRVKMAIGHQLFGSPTISWSTITPCRLSLTLLSVLWYSYRSSLHCSWANSSRLSVMYPECRAHRRNSCSFSFNNLWMVQAVVVVSGLKGLLNKLVNAPTRIIKSVTVIAKFMTKRSSHPRVD